MNKTAKPNDKPKNENSQNESTCLNEQEASITNPTGRRVFLAPIPVHMRRLPPGFMRNPLLKLNPYMMCPCRSEKKLKFCCLKTLEQVVPTAVGEKYIEAMKTDKLTFLTKENMAEMQVAQDMRTYFEEQERIEREAKNAITNDESKTS